jgi:protein-tyrosine phosphatase
LLLPDPKINHPTPLLRTCLSHPSTSPNSSIRFNDNNLSPLKFTSLPVLTSPPAKRLRPQTLTCTTTNLSAPIIPAILITSSSSSSITFLDSSELAEKLEENCPITIFDCGSPFRFSENHISNSTLLRVSDKISRKRLKSNPTKHLIVDLKQLHECNSIILYDDNTDNHHELSPGLKCACEEIQRCLTINSTPIYILKNSFNHFYNLYPNLCESLQTPSLPIDDLSSSQSTPISPTLDLQNQPMTHILNGVFIGSESNAKNLEELSSEQIRHIVNVTSHVPLYHSGQFHYYHISADDTQKQNLLDYFDQAYSFISNAIANQEKVLVHCVAGISRSPAIVISFLMRYAHMNLNDAYEFVKKKRSIVSPNLNFMGQLLQYEKKLREQK